MRAPAARRVSMFALSVMDSIACWTIRRLDYLKPIKSLALMLLVNASPQ